MKPIVVVALTILSLALSATASARSNYQLQLPNTPNGCNTCHTDGGGSARNVFGAQIETYADLNDGAVLENAGNNGTINWPLLCGLDADGDGVTNGAELGDACCAWPNVPAGPAAGDPADPNNALADSCDACDPATWVQTCDADGVTLSECDPSTNIVTTVDCSNLIEPFEIGGLEAGLVCGAIPCVDDGSGACDLLPARACVGDVETSGLCTSPFTFQSSASLPNTTFCEAGGSCITGPEELPGGEIDLTQRCIDSGASDCEIGEPAAGCTGLGVSGGSGVMQYCFDFVVEGASGALTAQRPYGFACSAFGATCVEGTAGGSSCALDDEACFSNFGFFTCGAGGMASGACDYAVGLPLSFGGEGNDDALGRCIPDVGDCTPRNNDPTDSAYLPSEYVCQGEFLVVDCHTYTQKPFGFDCTRTGGACGAIGSGASRCISGEGQPCQITGDLATDINPFVCAPGLQCGSQGLCVPGPGGGDGDGDNGGDGDGDNGGDGDGDNGGDGDGDNGGDGDGDHGGDGDGNNGGDGDGHSGGDGDGNTGGDGNGGGGDGDAANGGESGGREDDVGGWTGGLTCSHAGGARSVSPESWLALATLLGCLSQRRRRSGPRRRSR